MGWVVYTISMIVGTAAIIGTIITGVIMNKKIKGIDIEHNRPIVDNMNPQFANGHTQLLELSTKTMKNGNILVVGLPIDVRFKDNLDFQPEIKPVEFVVGRGYRRAAATGEYSDHREIVKYLPKHPEDVTTKFIDGKVGEELSKEAITQKVRNNLRKHDEAGDEATAWLVTESAKGQLSRKRFAEAETLSKEISKAANTIPKVPEETKK